MGLKGDISEVASVWKTSSLPMKIWLVLSLFLATAQLASLSEIVAKWKGFILTGIEFYREYFRTPVTSFLSDYFFIRYDDDFIDCMSLLVITAIAATREIIIDCRLYGWFIRDYFVIVSTWVFFILAMHFNINKDFDFYNTLITPILIGYVLMLVTAYPPTTHGQKIKFIYLITPPFIVSILAAINLGLS